MKILEGLSVVTNNMRIKLIVGVAFFGSIFWLGPIQASCSPIDAGSANAVKCIETTDEGLCNANTECTWSAPSAPVVGVPEPVNEKEIIKLRNPLSSSDIPTIVGNAIKVAMGIMGSLALVVFVYGGFRWLTAAGNSESIETGTSAMIWATIGIFIIFSSYAILQLVFNAIGVQNRGTTTPVTGVGGDYCLVSCKDEADCRDTKASSGKELTKEETGCTYSKFTVKQGTCAGVAECKK